MRILAVDFEVALPRVRRAAEEAAEGLLARVNSQVAKHVILALEDATAVIADEAATIGEGGEARVRRSCCCCSGGGRCVRGCRRHTAAGDGRGRAEYGVQWGRG